MLMLGIHVYLGRAIDMYDLAFAAVTLLTALVAAMDEH